MRGPLVEGGLKPLAHQYIFDASKNLLRTIPSGPFEWHEVHSHWHFEGYLFYELFEVRRAAQNPGTPRHGELEAIGEGRKVGSCPSDERIPAWDRVDQSAQGSARRQQSVSGYEGDNPGGAGNAAGACTNPRFPAIRLSAGWGDFYEWQRAEQYVALGEDAEGLFVLRSTADADNRIAETNDEDNQSYALIRVASGEVSLLESGYGSDPFDKDKEVIWHAP